MPFPVTPVATLTMDKLNVVVDVPKEKETSPDQQPVLCGFDYLVKPDMFEVPIVPVPIVPIANSNSHNQHDKPDAPCARYETVIVPPDGVETDLKRDGVVTLVVTGRNECEKSGGNEKNKKHTGIECAATVGTESDIVRPCYGCGSGTASCAASATLFDLTIKGKGQRNVLSKLF